MLAELDLGLEQQTFEGGFALDVDLALFAGDDELDLAVGDERQAEFLALGGAGGGDDGGGAAGGGELGQSAGGVIGRRPDRVRRAVDHDLDGLGGTHDDGSAFGEGGVRIGADDVMLAEGHALLGEDALHGAGERRDLLDLAVDVERDGLVGVGYASAGGHEGRDGDRGDDGGALAPARLGRRGVRVGRFGVGCGGSVGVNLAVFGGKFSHKRRP